MSKLMLIASCLLVSACTSTGEDEIILPEPTPLKVETVTVNPKPVAFEILCDGVVKAGRKQDMYFPQNGRLLQLRVGPGQRVRPGDTLAIMEHREAFLALQEASLRLEEASYAFESAMMSFYHVPDLADTIRKSVWHSSGLAMAESVYKARKLAWQRHFLLARVPGYVVNLLCMPGDPVHASETFGVVFSPGEAYVEAHVLELHASRVTTGMAAKLRDMTGRSVGGLVVAVDPWVDEDGFFRVRIKPDTPLNNPGGHLTVTLLSRLRDGLIVPVEAVMARSDRLMVYAVENGTARWKYIRGGMQTTSGLEVLEGLEAGDTVITDRLAELSHGVLVEATASEKLAGQ